MKEPQTANLETLGWNASFSQAFEKIGDPALMPGRVISEQKGFYGVATAEGEFLGEISGKFSYQAQQRNDYPAVGDWVAAKKMPNTDRVVIHHILPRQSKFTRIAKHSRKNRDSAGEEQVIASNITTVFLMQGLDGNYNLRRLERFLVTIWESGARPVIILNKADQCGDTEIKLAEAAAVAPGVPIHAISALHQNGIDTLAPYLNKGETVALIGSSGVGKSTLVNALLGKSVQKTADVRLKDSEGQHTTTQRQIFILSNGSLLLDTPGIRELQLAETTHGIEDVFDDIELIAAACRFKDCRHMHEAGCAVQKALLEGSIDEKRLKSFQKLQREAEFIESKSNKNIMFKRKHREKSLSRTIKRFYKDNAKRED